jgi:hypothetical protein
MPSDLAVLKLMISSTFTACWTGKSAGLSLKNTTDIDAGLAIRVSKAGSGTHQATSGSKLAHFGNCGEHMACRERRELNGPAVEERITADDDGARPHMDEGRKGCVQIPFAAGVQDIEV